MTRNRLFTGLLVLAALLAGLLLAWSPQHAVDPGRPPLVLATPPEGGDFTLDSAAGPVKLAALRGRVVLIYFGYTICPDICPTNLALLAAALKALTPDELKRVSVLFVSVDPERDDVRRLADYSAYFHPAIQGITGTPAQVAQVAQQYGAAYQRAEQTGSALGYLVDHSAYTYVVDPAGKLVQRLDHATLPDQIVDAIRRTLNAHPPQP